MARRRISRKVPAAADVPLTDELSGLHAQFNRACIATEDLSQAARYLDEALRPNSDHVREGLLQAAVVSYARAFIESATGGGRSTGLLPLRALRSLTVEQRALHKRVIALRQGAVAHSDFELNRVELLNASMDGWGASVGKFNVHSAFMNPKPFLELAWAMHMWAMRHRHELGLKIGARDA